MTAEIREEMRRTKSVSEKLTGTVSPVNLYMVVTNAALASTILFKFAARDSTGFASGRFFVQSGRPVGYARILRLGQFCSEYSLLKYHLRQFMVHSSFRRDAMLIGYARVSTRDQNYELQLDALASAGCTKIFEEKLSGAQRDRPELKAALDCVRPGDALVV